MTPLISPRLVKYYAAAACLAALLMIVLLLPIVGMGLWYIASPVAANLKDFTYEDATGFGAQFSLKEENKRLFQHIDMEDYIQRPEYYFNILKIDQATRVPEVTIQMMSFTAIFMIVLVMHWRLYRRMKGMGA